MLQYFPVLLLARSAGRYDKNWLFQTIKETLLELDLLTKYPYSEQLIPRSRYEYIYISPHLDETWS